MKRMFLGAGFGIRFGLYGVGKNQRELKEIIFRQKTCKFNLEVK